MGGSGSSNDELEHLSMGTRSYRAASDDDAADNIADAYDAATVAYI